MNLLAAVFVAGLWQGMVLVAVVWLGLRALPRFSAGVRFAVWAGAFAVAVVLPFVHFVHGEAGSGGAVVRVGAGWGLAVAVVWVGMSVWRLSTLVAEGLRLRGIWRRAVPVADSGGDLSRGLKPGVVGQDVLSRGLKPEGLAGVLGRAELCVSGDVDSPSVIGFWAPRLLIPEGLIGRLTDGELRQIVLHECEHLRRRDDWMNLAQKVALALFPLNPALLFVDRRLGLERELACDAGVVAATAEPFDYARCLTRLAEHRMGARRVALALSAWSRKPELVERVQRLLRPVRAMSVVQARVAVAVLAVGLGGAAVEMARVPGLVAFETRVEGQGSRVQSAAVVGAGSGNRFEIPDSRSQMAVMVAGTAGLGEARMTLAKAVVPADGPGLKPGLSGLPNRGLKAPSPSVFHAVAISSLPNGGLKASPSVYRAFAANAREAVRPGQQNSEVLRLRLKDDDEKQATAGLGDRAVGGREFGDRVVDLAAQDRFVQDQPRVVMTRAEEMVSRGPDGVVRRYAVRAVYAVAQDVPEGTRSDGVGVAAGTAQTAQTAQRAKSLDSDVRYAAVPFGNGWLIIQL